MIQSFFLNLFLAIVYVALLGSFTALDLILGLAIGLVIVWIINHMFAGQHYGQRILAVCSFVVYFIGILIKANLQVAKFILTPGLNFSPRVMRYPVAGLTEAEITTLANAITLTPGTLSADISEDCSVLYIHCMHAPDRDAAIAELDAMRDRLLREVFAHES
jgi:multicomponent Na+:H+ antiporter subunit E